MNEINLQNLECFSGIDEISLNKLKESSKVLRYGIGQPMSNRNKISNTIQIIASGEARLVGCDEDKNFTIAKLGPGAIIGLTSLLRASSCEEVNASTEIICVSIPDEEIISLYKSSSYFKNWCNSNKQISDIFEIAQTLLERSNNVSIKLNDIFSILLKSSHRKIVANNTRLDNEKLVYLANSGNIKGYRIGEKISIGEAIESDGPLPIQLLSIEMQEYERIISNEGVSTTKYLKDDDDEVLKIAEAPLLPGVSGMELGQYTNRRKLELVAAEGSVDEARACLQMLSEYLELPFRKDSVEKILRDSLLRGVRPSLDLCGNLAGMLGLQAYGASVPTKYALRLQTPSIITYQNGFAILYNTSSKGLVIASPKDGWVKISSNKLDENFPDGLEVLLVDRTNETPEKRFGVSWFLPALKRYKGILLQVLLASFVVQLFTLANPLLIQVIIDKVINQRSLDTLQVLGFALIVVTILGGFLGSLRTFLFTETTNRIDTTLGAEVIDHLLRLPLKYFDKRPVGELGTRVAELEKIRNFLTGQALTTILDASFSIIYIIVMMIYSSYLTAIALAVVPIQVALTLIGAPLIRKQIRNTAETNAKTQSLLVEVLTGMQTVKAQNVETVSRWKWQDLYTNYISKSFEKTITSTVLGEVSSVLQQLSQLLVLWIGASQVLNGQLTLGQLIAFRIISGYVTQPLLRLSSIWQSIQELRVSFERLADIIDTPEESSATDKSNIPIPPIEGSVKFQDISFRFTPSSADTLKNINLEIDAGKFVGIVGQSGSGKSTLMKLLPRLYSPNTGKISIDNYDISKVELYSLRRQIGIVPQDPLLFAGTVSENIALTDPKSESDEIINASKLAEAHDFIMQLPLGYSTQVGERGSTLSGGQRQRIAIARTILSKPKMLILDEATSALDYATEKKVCENLRESCKDRSVFFITHRLSTIKNADLIIMMEQGAIAEVGTHNELMDKRGRYYALYRQQDSN